MTERLRIANEALYRVFSSYTANDMTGSSSYGNIDQWNKEILSKPLRELEAHDLFRFTGKAMTTWGSSTDYKHFLPRIFELIAQYKTPYEIWVAFEKLHWADWKNWPVEERETVEEWMHSLWENMINDKSQEAEWEFQNYFSAIAYFYPNFGELLDVWTSSESKSSTKHLVNYIIDQQNALLVKKEIEGFYNRSENAEELIEWMLSDKILDKIQKKYCDLETENFAEKISWAEQIITIERKQLNR